MKVFKKIMNAVAAVEKLYSGSVYPADTGSDRRKCIFPKK